MGKVTCLDKSTTFNTTEAIGNNSVKQKKKNFNGTEKWKENRDIQDE